MLGWSHDSDSPRPPAASGRRRGARLHDQIDAAAESPLWTLDAAATEELLGEVTRLRARVAELELRITANADRIDVGARHDATSTASWWAHTCRITRAQAHRRMRLARRLQEHEHVAHELAAGEIADDRPRWSWMRSTRCLPTWSTPRPSAGRTVGSPCPLQGQMLRKHLLALAGPRRHTEEPFADRLPLPQRLGAAFASTSSRTPPTGFPTPAASPPRSWSPSATRAWAPVSARRNWTPAGSSPPPKLAGSRAGPGSCRWSSAVPHRSSTSAAPAGSTTEHSGWRWPSVTAAAPPRAATGHPACHAHHDQPWSPRWPDHPGRRAPALPEAPCPRPRPELRDDEVAQRRSCPAAKSPSTDERERRGAGVATLGRSLARRLFFLLLLGRTFALHEGALGGLLFLFLGGLGALHGRRLLLRDALDGRRRHWCRGSGLGGRRC